MLHFTSDTHFFHKNIVRYCNRPYWRIDQNGEKVPDPDTMTRDMVAKWNEVVGKNDTVVHLGDFGFASPGKLLGVRQALNGKIFLIKGNHDKSPSKWLLPGVDKWAHSFVVDDVFFGHVPPGSHDYRDLEPEPMPENTKVMICGHVHQKWKEKDHNGIRVINVGCDLTGLRPVSLAELGLGPEYTLKLHSKFGG